MEETNNADGVRVVARFFVKGDVRSSKNSRRSVKDGGGTLRVIKGDAAKAYANSSVIEWMRHAKAFREACAGLAQPYSVAFQWHRKTEGSFDHTGPLEMALDCMTGKMFKDQERRNPGICGRASWIDDDDVSRIQPLPLSKVVHAKDAPGVEVILLSGDPLASLSL
jgi:hypothetical protein